MTALDGVALDGRYRLDAQIGAGGMSTVYRAYDLILERAVAIKLMHREFAGDSEQLERFRREGRAVAQLSHPHIVGVIDACQGDGQPYIVLELIAGETLKQRIRRLGRLPLDEAVAYAIEIARALEYAHARGIVHRDVKPQNVLLDEEGSAKVTDFGIARTLDEHGLTADGRVVGTTDYVSPEQALGQPVTGQSDIYSLGIVLWEMLVGEVPFRGDNPVTVAMKHVREPLPDVQVYRAGVSASLAAAIDRATAKELSRRCADAGELASDLEDALVVEAGRTGTTTGEATAVLRALPERRRRRVPVRARHPARLAAAVSLMAAVVALILIALADNTHRGIAPEISVNHAQSGLRVVPLAQTAAHDLDPYGGDGENPGQVGFAVDGDPNTYWSTEHYHGPLDKPGVGIYVDAKPSVAARRLVIQTPDPGWTATIFAAPAGPPPAGPPPLLPGQTLGSPPHAPPVDPAWTQVSQTQLVNHRQATFALDTLGLRLRYYLVWISALPPSGMARITQISLLARG